MSDIRITVTGLKNLSDERLEEIFTQLSAADRETSYSSILHEPMSVVMGKVKREAGRRKNSKYVWLEFTATWRGYQSSQDRVVGKHYRKVTKENAEKIPSFLVHHFDDNTTNEWVVKRVSARGEATGSYGGQIDELITKHTL